MKAGRVDPGSARLLARLQKYREQPDYGIVTIFTNDDVEQDLREIDRFLQTVRPRLDA
ncbi:MAG: hypothetical protein HY207_03590 [Nitrospirae bacterium]|nr:hypothetical protein [Nitrospirota bacterium]